MDVSQPLVSDPSRRIETILLATDLSAASAAATRRAIDLAKQLQARLLVVNVIDARRSGLPPGRILRPVEERVDRAEAASRVVQLARSAGVEAEFLVWEGDAGDGILAAAEAESADLIVVGSRGRSSLGRYLLGSISDAVVHRADCPVLVVRPDA